MRVLLAALVVLAMVAALLWSRAEHLVLGAEGFMFGYPLVMMGLTRAVGLGANLPADAMYPNARVDAGGQPLHGDHRYRLHFAPGALPPVKAFWSLKAYGAYDYLIDNPLQRHALGSREALAVDANGSLDLWIQATPPEAARQANGLPVKAGERSC